MKSTNLLSVILNLQPLKVNTPPTELENFRKLSPKDRAERRDKFYGQPFVMQYMAHKWDVELHNVTSFKRLYAILELYREDTRLDKLYPLPPNADPREKIEKKILEKLTEFRHVMEANPRPFTALAIDFDKYPFKLTHAAPSDPHHHQQDPH